jgi:hypothetical protein
MAERQEWSEEMILNPTEQRMKGCNPSPAGKLMRAMFVPTSLANLPPPPPDYDAHNGCNKYRYFLNNSLGDCVVAQYANAITGLTFATLGTPTNINDSDVRSNYFAQTGGRDSGLDLASALDYWNQHGLVDANGKLHKPDIYGGVDPQNIEEFDMANYYCDGLDIAIATPSSFMNSNDGDTLDWTGGNPGGIDHCVGISGRRADGCFKLITWGGIRWVTPNWIKACTGEAWATPLTADRLTTNLRTVEGFDVAELKRQFAVFQGKPFDV